MLNRACTHKSNNIRALKLRFEVVEISYNLSGFYLHRRVSA